MKQLEMEADCLGSKQKEQSAWGDVLQCFEVERRKEPQSTLFHGD